MGSVRRYILSAWINPPRHSAAHPVKGPILTRTTSRTTLRSLRRLLPALALAAGLIPVTSSAQVCGDADGDGQLQSADVFYLFSYLFESGPAPNSLTVALFTG